MPLQHEISCNWPHACKCAWCHHGHGEVQSSAAARRQCWNYCYRGPHQNKQCAHRFQNPGRTAAPPRVNSIILCEGDSNLELARQLQADMVGPGRWPTQEMWNMTTKHLRTVRPARARGARRGLAARSPGPSTGRESSVPTARKLGLPATRYRTRELAASANSHLLHLRHAPVRCATG